MATQALVGTAYVKLMPTMKGFASKVNQELATSGLTKNMSKAMSAAINNGVKVTKVEGVSKLGSAISGAGDAFKSFAPKAMSALKSVGSAAAQTAGKINDIAKGMTAAGAAATVAIGSSALKAFSDNEQLVGGIDTLYKDASAKMQDYANNAFQTTGMSANAYMESVTGFSAALISSLGGDTAKAADYADTAMQDLADNANKMGTDMESLTQTYQSLARGNFGMLDNLKLGYGGTKEEAERLLADAEKISGIHYDISNFADITQAIHVIQKEMGIAGATAEEAATTVEGSTKMMKASWQNWVTGLGQDNADMQKLTSNLVNSINTMLGNVLPRLGQIFQSIASELPNLISSILEKAPQMITDILPSLIQSITGAMGAIAASIPQMLQAFIPALAQGIADGLNQLSEMIESDGGEFAQTLQTLITDALDTLLPAIYRFMPNLYTIGAQVLVAIIQGFLESVSNNTTQLADGIKTLVTNLAALVPQLVNTIMNVLIQAGPTIIQALIQSLGTILQQLATMLPTLVPQLVQLLLGIVDVLLENIDIIIQAAFDIAQGLLQGLINALPIIINKLPELITQVVDALVENIDIIIDGTIQLVEMIVEHLPEIIMALLDAMPKIVDSLFNALIKAAPKLIEAGFRLIEKLGEGIWQMIGKLPEIVGKIVTTILDVLADLPGQLWELGGQIVQGLIDGITGAIGSVGDAIGNLGDSAVQGLKDLLGIHSPSKVFEQLGEYTMQGFTNGLNNGKKDVLKQMSGLSDSMQTSVDVDASRSANKQTAQYVANIDTSDTSQAEALALAREFKDAVGNIAIYMDSTQVSKLTANARDRVDGSRKNFANRGMAVA